MLNYYAHILVPIQTWEFGNDFFTAANRHENIIIQTSKDKRSRQIIYVTTHPYGLQTLCIFFVLEPKTIADILFNHVKLFLVSTNSFFFFF